MADDDIVELSPTQRVVVAQRLAALRRARDVPVGAKGGARPNGSGGLTLLERGRQPRASLAQLRELASSQGTTAEALMAVPAHVETFDATDAVRRFSTEEWPERFALLMDAFELDSAQVIAAISRLTAHPHDDYALLEGSGEGLSEASLRALALLTGAQLGWLCLGLKMPGLEAAGDLREPLPVVGSMGEDTRHDIAGWTSAHTQKASRYTRR